MARGVWIGLGGVVLAGLVYLGWEWYRGEDLRLSTPPERSAAGLPLPERESDIALRMRVPFALLQQAIEQSIPGEFSRSENGPDVGRCHGPRQLRICVGTKYEFTAHRSPVSLQRAADKVRASLHVDISGKGGFRGDGAKLLKLDAKSFQAAADIAGDLGIRIGSDWCPIPNLSLTYNWTQSPRVEIIGGVWVGIEGHVHDSVKKFVDEVPNKIRQAIPCDHIRGEVQKAWRDYDFPVQIPNGPTAHIGLQPISIGTSGVIVGDDHVRMAVSLRVRTQVSTTPVNLGPIGPLPPPQEAPDAPGKIQIALPVYVGYEAARGELLGQFGNRDIPFQVNGQEGTIRISDLLIYPSGEALALGLTFAANIPGRIFDVGGQVFLSARPVVENQGNRLRLADISLRRDLDNSLWDVLSVAFDTLIREQIGKAAALDLSEPAQQAIAAMNAVISNPANTGGIKLTVTEPSLSLERVVPQAEAMAILANVQATVEAELASINP